MLFTVNNIPRMGVAPCRKQITDEHGESQCTSFPYLDRRDGVHLLSSYLEAWRQKQFTVLNLTARGPQRKVKYGVLRQKGAKVCKLSRPSLWAGKCLEMVIWRRLLRVLFSFEERSDWQKRDLISTDYVILSLSSPLLRIISIQLNNGNNCRPLLLCYYRHHKCPDWAQVNLRANLISLKIEIYEYCHKMSREID